MNSVMARQSWLSGTVMPWMMGNLVLMVWAPDRVGSRRRPSGDGLERGGDTLPESRIATPCGWALLALLHALRRRAPGRYSRTRPGAVPGSVEPGCSNGRRTELHPSSCNYFDD